MLSIVFFAVLLVAFLALFVRTQKQLARARSWAPEVAAGVRTPEGTLVFRRVVLFFCSLAAVGGLIAMIQVHDSTTWTDGEVLQVARNAADRLSAEDSVTSPGMLVNSAVTDAMHDADGPGLLSVEPAVTSDDDADSADDSGYLAYDQGGATRYVISDHGTHTACLTVTSTAGDAPVLVPDASGDGSSAIPLDTYGVTASASPGDC